MTIAVECLKILMILQTLSKANEYRKELVNLLLEAVLMITSDGSLSQVIPYDKPSDSCFVFFFSILIVNFNYRKQMNYEVRL